MTTYARFINDVVAEIIDFNPAGRFTGEIAALFVEVPDGTGINDTANGDGTFTKYIAPPEPEPPPAPIDPCEWLIDTGAFYDRFGAAKMAVLTSQDVGVKAIITDVAIRKWIDLQRADVAQSLAYIGSVVPSVDATLQASILTTPVSAVENLALRKLYF